MLRDAPRTSKGEVAEGGGGGVSWRAPPASQAGRGPALGCGYQARAPAVLRTANNGVMYSHRPLLFTAVSSKGNEST